MDMYVPLDEVPANAVPLSGMNQELLSKAEYLGVYSVTSLSQGPLLHEKGRLWVLLCTFTPFQFSIISVLWQ